ncbi:Dehydrogenase/reductase SDR family member 7B [Pseudocercospora fuligena]|uniref:Dehydrogenase/reductase SDR family member 7B n=1 Tax=Pseudocercospora fuligena TaxID=685502 RepID=A0A8H6RD96_9PEZI|nr:Dehydrogenase/reductase SDR family member 7B [Pseudocercospora fuligena]
MPLPRVYESYDFISPTKYAGKLEGKVVAITGASAGIGRATTKAFAAAGASVACVARRENDLNVLVEEIKSEGGKAIAVVADVSQPGAPAHIISSVENQLGPIDILISNAGITRLSPLDAEKDLSIWWRCYEVNVLAPVSLIHSVLPSMKARKTGIIMTVSSAVASMALPCMSAYASSKAAISKFHESITPELAGSGILSFAVNPGMVGGTELGSATNAINKDASEHPAMVAFMEHIKEAGASGKFTAQDVPANFMVALCADARAKNLSGMHVNADQDLEPVLDEMEKEGHGQIGEKDLYKVRIHEL